MKSYEIFLDNFLFPISHCIIAMKKKVLTIIITSIIGIDKISGFLFYYFGFKGYFPDCVDDLFSHYPLKINEGGNNYCYDKKKKIFFY
jgi:hypothetical protein